MIPDIVASQRRNCTLPCKTMFGSHDVSIHFDIRVSSTWRKQKKHEYNLKPIFSHQENVLTLCSGCGTCKKLVDIIVAVILQSRFAKYVQISQNITLTNREQMRDQRQLHCFQMYISCSQETILSAFIISLDDKTVKECYKAQIVHNSFSKIKIGLKSHENSGFSLLVGFIFL